MVMVMINANSGLFAPLNFFKHVIVLIFLAAKEDKHYYTGNWILEKVISGACSYIALLVVLQFEWKLSKESSWKIDPCSLKVTCRHLRSPTHIILMITSYSLSVWSKESKQQTPAKNKLGVNCCREKKGIEIPERDKKIMFEKPEVVLGGCAPFFPFFF